MYSTVIIKARTQICDFFAILFDNNINGIDDQSKNVVNNVDKSCSWAP